VPYIGIYGKRYIISRQGAAARVPKLVIRLLQKDGLRRNQHHTADGKRVQSLLVKLLGIGDASKLQLVVFARHTVCYRSTPKRLSIVQHKTR
jgi:hypothetical protein